MKTFKIGDRVKVKEECVGKHYRDANAKDGGLGTITETGRVHWRVKLDSDKTTNISTYGYYESELTLLDEYKGYRLLKPITLKAVYDNGPCETEWDNFLACYGVCGWNDVLDFDTVLANCLEDHPDWLVWFIVNGFVGKVGEELKPCPFCGKTVAQPMPHSKLNFGDNEREWTVVCDACKGEGGTTRNGRESRRSMEQTSLKRGGIINVA